MGDASFDHNIFYAIHYFLEVDPIPLKPFLQLEQIPLGRILLIVLCIRCSTFDIVVGLLVYGVVRQMDKPLLQVFWIVGVFLSGEADQPFFE